MLIVFFISIRDFLNSTTTRIVIIRGIPTFVVVVGTGEARSQRTSNFKSGYMQTFVHKLGR